jgi:hypothetical protein
MQFAFVLLVACWPYSAWTKILTRESNSIAEMPAAAQSDRRRCRDVVHWFCPGIAVTVENPPQVIEIGGLQEAGLKPAAGKIARPPTWFSSLFVGRRPILTGMNDA